MRCSRLAFPSACLVDTPSHLYPPFVSFSRLRQVERMECGCVYDILSGSGTRSKTFRSCKIHRIYKLCRTARTEAADSRRSRDATTHGRERKNVFIATAPRVIHAFIQRNFNEISTELHRSLGMSSRIVSLVSC